MTGYYLEVGYNSGEAGIERAWNRLKAIVADLRANPERIAAEVRRLEPSWGDAELREFTERYADVGSDQTLSVVEECPPHVASDDFSPYVSQLASGGGTGRELKEACRRAFCRLTIESMHRERLEVNLRVS